MHWPLSALTRLPLVSPSGVRSMCSSLRAARAGVAHHPEVILLVTVDNMHGGIKAGGGEDLRPIIVCLLINSPGSPSPGLYTVAYRRLSGNPRR